MEEKKTWGKDLSGVVQEVDNVHKCLKTFIEVYDFFYTNPFELCNVYKLTFK